jgi:hypothetical protein
MKCTLILKQEGNWLARLWQLTGRAENLIKRQIKFNGIRGKCV